MTNKEDHFMFKMDLNQLDSILNKIYLEYRNKNIKIEVDPFASGIRMRNGTMNELLVDFKLDEENFGELIHDVVFFIRALIMDDEEGVFKKYGKSDQTVRVLNIFKRWFHTFPDMMDDIRFKSFCKTQYLENITWEISMKVMQDGGASMKLPVSLVKMNFLKPSASMACPLRVEEAVTFECTLQGVRDMIKSLKEVEHALQELEGGGDMNV